MVNVKEKFEKAKDGVENVWESIWTKKKKYTENEDGAIVRELKIGKQKIEMTADRCEDGSYVISSMAPLDDKNKKKLTDKIKKGKKLSRDDQLYVNLTDKICVAEALKKMGYDDKIAGAHLKYPKEVITKEMDAGTFFVDIKGFDGDKKALLEGIKARMIAVYGPEVGEKHFEDFVKLSGAAEEVKTLDDKEKDAPTTEQEKKTPETQEQAPADKQVVSETQEQAPTDRKVVSETQEQKSPEQVAREVLNGINEEEKDALRRLLAEQAQSPKYQNSTPRSVPEGNVEDVMRNDALTAKVQDLVNRPGVKLQNSEETFEKLIQNFGPEAAYEIALKCVVEPANAMSAMGEEFKRSGASMEYFASIDPNDTEKMARVVELIGVPVENMPSQKVDLDEKMVKIEPIELEPIVPTHISVDVATLDVSKVKIKTPAELAYDRMAGGKDQVSLADLEKAGVNLETDFLPTLKALTKDNPEKLGELAPQGLGDKDKPVSKEFAVALIGRKQQRDAIAKHNGKSR